MFAFSKRQIPHSKINSTATSLTPERQTKFSCFYFPFCLALFHKFNKQVPQAYLSVEALHLLSSNCYISLKLLNHIYSWLVQSECKYSFIRQIFPEHLLCERHSSQHLGHNREQSIPLSPWSLHSSGTEKSGKKQVYIQYIVSAQYPLGMQEQPVLLSTLLKGDLDFIF